jgi:ABC-2 type transport system permease protein
MGKFLGTLLFYILLLATTLFHFGLMEIHSDPIISVVVVGYLGMILIGALFISIGIFASCCTKHQLLAAIVSIVILAVFTFIANYYAEYADHDWQRQVCSYLNIMYRFSDFSKGIIDTRSVIFFITGIGFFLFLANKILESQRWR